MLVKSVYHSNSHHNHHTFKLMSLVVTQTRSTVEQVTQGAKF